MSRFYASIKGSRGEATRQGTPKSGITGHVRGWRVGVRVWVDVNDEGKDEVKISLTSGLKCGKPDKFIGIFTAEDLD